MMQSKSAIQLILIGIVLLVGAFFVGTHVFNTVFQPNISQNTYYLGQKIKYRGTEYIINFEGENNYPFLSDDYVYLNFQVRASAKFPSLVVQAKDPCYVLVDKQGNEIMSSGILSSEMTTIPSGSSLSAYSHGQTYKLPVGQEAYAIRYYPDGLEKKPAFDVLVHH